MENKTVKEKNIMKMIIYSKELQKICLIGIGEYKKKWKI